MIHSFLLIGQSNMAGRGLTEEAIPVDTSRIKKIAEDNPMTGFVSAEGLGAKPDNLHFNAKALHEFGLRYFEEFEKYRDENKIFVEKPCEDDALRTKMEEL